MRGSLRFFWWQGRVSLLVSMLLGFLLGWLLTYPIGPLSAGILKMVSQEPVLQKLLSAMMGSELDGPMTVKLLIGSTWSHPFVLALLWTYVMVGCSRYPAQYVQDGTIDWLLSQPLSRSSVLLAQTLQVLVGVALIVVSLTFGFFVGCGNLNVSAVSLRELALVGGNLFMTGVFFLGFSSLVSCLCSQRMRVLGWTSAFIFWSLLLGFLKPFWGVARTLAPSSLLNYFRPGEVLRTGEIELFSACVLLLGGLVLWLVAMRVLARRDLT